MLWPTADQLRQAIDRLYVPSLYGRLAVSSTLRASGTQDNATGLKQIDVTGRLAPGDVATGQIIGDRVATQLVTPLSIGAPPVYPMPSWNERTENIGKFGACSFRGLRKLS